MRKIFYISGLGANERAFERLENFGLERVMVAWMSNEKDESLEDYTKRIIDKYSISSNDVVVGLSFGGLVAQQIAEVLGLEFVILISSFRTKDDLRPIFTNGLKYKLFKLLPEIKAPFISEIVANFLNSGSNLSRPLLKEMIESTDMKLMKWSIQKIYDQDNELAKEVKKYSLLGTKDRIVGPWANDLSYVIEGGTHFMVFDEAEEVSRIIREILELHQ